MQFIRYYYSKSNKKIKAIQLNRLNEAYLLSSNNVLRLIYYLYFCYKIFDLWNMVIKTIKEMEDLIENIKLTNDAGYLLLYVIFVKG